MINPIISRSISWLILLKARFLVARSSYILIKMINYLILSYRHLRMASDILLLKIQPIYKDEKRRERNHYLNLKMPPSYLLSFKDLETTTDKLYMDIIRQRHLSGI